jgi:hypothetical protein
MEEGLGSFLVTSLISQIDWNDPTRNHKDQGLIQLLSTKIQSAFTQPNYSSIFCGAADNIQVGDDFISVFSTTLKLTFVQEIIFAFSLTFSTVENVAKLGISFVLH